MSRTDRRNNSGRNIVFPLGEAVIQISAELYKPIFHVIKRIVTA